MIDVDANDLRFMLIATVRYSLHRCSVAPTIAVELFLKYREYLDEQTIAQMRHEIQREIELAEKLGRYVGDRCDHEVWQQLVNCLER